MSNQAFAPLQQTQFTLKDFQSEEGINRLNQYFTNITRTVNANIGSGGPVAIPSGIDVKGATISNVGGVGPQHEAVSKAYAEANYSAAAIAPQLEGGGKNALRSVRRINDASQRESYSTWLNQLMNTTPTGNTSVVQASGFTATVTAGLHKYLDGSVVGYASRSDTLSGPTTIVIVSLTRASNVVTAVTATPSGLLPGDSFTVSGASDSSFNGTFIVATVISPTSFTYSQTGADEAATGGTLNTSRIFYYFLQTGKRTLSLSQPFDSDTQSNRVSVNLDGNVLIAVVAVNGSGIDLSNSMSGATPPAQTGNARIINRL